MDKKTPWQKILNALQSAASKFLTLPFHKKTGYFLLFPPALGVINFLINTRFGTSADGIVDNGAGLNLFWLYAWDGASSPIPIFLGLMAIAGAYLIKDSKQ